MIERERQGSTLILRLAHGKASALDLELLQALTAALRDADESDARAVVLTGTGKIFCAGVDLHRLVKGGGDYVEAFLPALDEALIAGLRLTKPLVAAINGHAIAGGAILAWTADWRCMTSGGARIGIPELQVGVPFPVVPLEIARAAVPSRFLRSLAYRAELWPAEVAHQNGAVDELCDPEHLLPKALEQAEALGALHPPSFAATRKVVNGRLLQRIAELEEAQQEVVRVWSQPETLEAVQRYIEKTLPRPK